MSAATIASDGITGEAMNGANMNGPVSVQRLFPKVAPYLRAMGHTLPPQIGIAHEALGP